MPSQRAAGAADAPRAALLRGSDARASTRCSGTLALPLLPLRLLWRGRREPGYREHIGERYGRYRGAVPRPVLWVHAVSLGETRAAAPLVERLRRAHPEATVLLTHMTATGRAAGRALFGDGVAAGVAALRRAVRGARVPRALQAARGPHHGNRAVAESRRAARARPACPLYLVNARMSAAIRARLRSRSRPCRGRCSPRCRASRRRRRPMRRDSPRSARPLAVVTGNLKFDAGAAGRRAKRWAGSCGRASAPRARCGSPRRPATARRR